MAAGGAFLAVVLSACFSERSSGPGTTAGECRVPVSAVDSQHVFVAIANFLFAPDSISVPAGATVTWLNCEPVGTEPHTTTSATSQWDSGEFDPGARYSREFATPGVYPYLCTSHPFMVGTIVVQ